MTNYNRHGYDIAIRKTDTGWYEVSTMVVSMGEEYRQRQLIDHKPTGADLDKFLSMVEALK